MRTNYQKQKFSVVVDGWKLKPAGSTLEDNFNEPETADARLKHRANTNTMIYVPPMLTASAEKRPRVVALGELVVSATTHAAAEVHPNGLRGSPIMELETIYQTIY